MLEMDKWEKAAQFHGHKCPGLAIGFRACEALSVRIPFGASADEEIVCVTENDTCAVDAVQSILSCTFGKGNLIYKPYGKMAFSFYFRESGAKIRILFKAIKNEEVSREDWMDHILNAPIDELFTFGEPKFELPEHARIFRSLVCEECGESAREDKIRLKNGKMVCLNCFQEYDR